MDANEIQKQVARLRVAMNTVNDETGGQRTQRVDVAMHDAFGALAILERQTQTQAPVVAA